MTLRPGGTIEGVVLDLDGRPVPGARVVVAGAHFENTKSGVDGRFKVEGLPAGRFQVSAMLQQERVVSWTAQAEVTLAEAERREIVLKPKPGALVAGVVISPAGEPVAEAQVMGWARPADGGYEPGGMATDKSGPDGRFRLRTLPAGEVTVMTQAKGFSPQQVKARAPDSNLVIKLEQADVVAGRVVDEQGAPVKQFRISSRPFDTQDGRFEMPVRRGKFELVFEAMGFAQRGVSVEAKSGRTDLGDVRLSKGRAIEGVVVDASTGKPVAGALVDVGLDDRGGSPELSERLGAVKTDAAGRYRLEAVDPSSAMIMATHQDYPATSRKLAPFEAKVDLAFQPGVLLRVMVVDAQDAPVQRAWVRAMTKGATPEVLEAEGTAGVYVTKSLRPGTYTLRVMTRGGTPFLPVEVELGEAAVELTIKEATEGATVHLSGGDAQWFYLVRGRVQAPTRVRELDQLLMGLEVQGGVAKHVPAGTWTVLAGRGDATPELAAQLIEVPKEGELRVTITAPFRPLSME